MNTEEVKEALMRAVQNPSNKRMQTLAKMVLALCDEYDSEPNLFSVIQENQKCIDATFDRLEKLSQAIKGC